MKPKYIIALVIITVAVGIIVLTAGDASTYVNFGQAQQMAAEGSTTPIHVVGQLKKDESGRIVGLENSLDKLSFSFVLIDDNKKEQKVLYNEPMPPDFLRSEKVVVIGGYQGDQFIAKKILLKCPSKYQEQKLDAGV
jgi:cytochrome c-type biogenesis protein CcmE